MNEKVKELKGIVVNINGEQVDLGEFTYQEFTDFMETLTDDEAKVVLEQIINVIGGEALMVFLAKLEEMFNEEDEALTGTGNAPGSDTPAKNETVKEKEDSRQPVLPPVKFVNMDDFYSYDPQIIVHGIDSVSDRVGQYLAYVNAGLTSAQAFELITAQEKREHELAVLDKQLELRKLEAEVQMKLSGVKQLLSR